jgi:hypothetical protein
MAETKQKAEEVKLGKELGYDLNAGRGWRVLGQVFVGLDLVTGILDLSFKGVYADPLFYVAAAAVGVGSYYVGHSERTHQTSLYIASKLERIANQLEKKQDSQQKPENH